MNQLITVPFTEPFLDHVAAYIEREYIVPGKDMRRLAIVFGGRRPALFLKRLLAQKIKKPFYPPQFLTMDELVTLVSTNQPATPGKAVSELEHALIVYNLVRRHTPQILKGRESFARFLPWAREIIHFIEQLDLENSGDDALAALREQARIGFSVPQDINLLLEAVMVLRQAYHKHLDKAALSVRGYRYLKAGRDVAQWDASAFDCILFCNIFYLHAMEMTMVKNLYDRGKAVLLVQGDQRRWPALERISHLAGAPVVEGKEVKPTSFDLKLYAAFDMHSQAGLIAEILHKIPNPEETVIVLPDADFMLPLLSTLAGRLGDFNISMGYPLRRSSLYALLEFVMAAQSSKREGLYYARDYLRVLRHPLVKGSMPVHSSAARVIVYTIEEVLTGEIHTPLSGKLFFTVNDIAQDARLIEESRATLKAMDIPVDDAGIREILKRIHQNLFDAWTQVRTPQDLAQAMKSILSFMVLGGQADDPLNARITEHMGIVAEEFAVLDVHDFFEEGELFKVLLERLKSEMVAFHGSPLRGLQVLGLFETRSLSFKDVIVADVNEGVLPNLNVYEPLIPREVMVKLNLDRLEFEEEIQRYQFMRLISCAERVHLIYQERPEKQKSRFVEELVWEEEKKHGRLGEVPVHRPGFRAEIPIQGKTVFKTAAMVDFLKRMTFSATSVNTYLRNPYEFYFKYVLGLREKDNLLDDPESKHIGIFVHDLLEAAFRPFVGKKPVLDDAFKRNFRALFERRFEQTLGSTMASDTFLIKEVLSARLDQFLQEELQRAEHIAEILYLEHAFEDTIDLAGGPVKFIYRVDRVDRMMDGTIMVIDYKTGGADKMPTPESIESFQMPLYLHYLDRLYPDAPVNAALYHLRTSKIEFFLQDAAVSNRTVLLPQYLAALETVMEEILDPTTPFSDIPEEAC